ncbi:hypothetical protein BDEG_26784 [Batrachochytrium dendrobatidis JEL423]|uniref:Uncharacterized protein n=1 Tax=Batrachochytrium dendrobatidis (strain JEL423) TaxID=403673 RepID=A0A177WU36_BATDL|nr:hypothetical protein BDEG_26784 [Batrachochytrium dendrobatidis JEL423]
MSVQDSPISIVASLGPWGPMEYGSLIYGLILIGAAIIRFGILCTKGFSATPQKVWGTTLVLILALIILDMVLTFVPGALTPISQCIAILLLWVIVSGFWYWQARFFYNLPRSVRYVNREFVTVITFAVVFISFEHFILAASCFPPLLQYQPQLMIMSMIWLGIIAICDLIQSILLFRFLAKGLDIPLPLKVRYTFFFIVSACSMIVGMLISPDRQYVTLYIGDLCVCGFALSSMFSLETISECSALRRQPGSHVKSNATSSHQLSSKK